MPDDERLGGTRDPHEYGRRHRREDGEEKPRRRRRSVESGGLSVADLVQKHTGSRPDLTPVDPSVPLRQNTLMHGRRSAENRPAEGIAEALENGHHAAFPTEDTGRRRAAEPTPGAFPADDAPRHGARHESSHNGFPEDPRRMGDGSGPRNGFPPDAPRRPGEGAHGFPADDGGFPTEAPRRAGGRNGHPADDGLGGLGGFPPEAPGRASSRGGYPADAPRGAGEGAHGFPTEDSGFPLEPPSRAGLGSPDAPGRAGQGSRNGFPAEAPRGAGEGAHGFPTEENGFPPEPPRRAGEGSGPRSGLPGRRAAAEPETGRRSRRASEAPHAFPGDGLPPEAEAPRRSARRTGERSAHHSIPGEDRNGFPPDQSRRGDGPVPDPNGFPADPGRRADHSLPEANGFFTDASGSDTKLSFPDTGGFPAIVDPNAFPADPGRRVGEAPRSIADGFPPGRRVGEASVHRPIPDPNGFPADPGRRVGEASTHRPIPDPNGFPADPGRRGGDPGGFPPDTDGPRRGARPVGEASTHRPVPDPNGFPADPGRRVGEASTHRPIPDPNGFPPDYPPDAESPRRGARRVGEASTQMQRPSGRRFPVEGRPEGAARRRAARGSAPEMDGRFPEDAPGQPGQTSARFPIDDPRRQGPPTPPPGRPPASRGGHVPLPGPAEPGSEPRVTPAAIDAPDVRKSSGVPPLPLPPPRRDDDLISMTTEMDAIDIGEDVQQRRKIDHTLARFSAVHDEIIAEEREKKAKRRKLRPWEKADEEMDRLDDLDAAQSIAMQVPVVDNHEPEPEPEDLEEEPQGRKKKKRFGRKIKGRTAGKAFVVIAAGMVFASTAAAWGFKSYIEASSLTVDALDPDSKAIQDAAAQRGDENFLLVGSDTRSGAGAEEGVGDEKAVGGARSDTVMIAHIPKDRERVVVVSFPRDLEVTRPACEGWDPKSGDYDGSQHPAQGKVKLNTAYQVGGPMCVTKMVQELSGLAVNHFVGIDFHGFKDMVDAVQGVEVCVERPLKDEVLGTVVPEAGKNVKLSGDEALNFVRARHVIGDPTSDYGRIIRQQRFLSSLLRKAMSGEVLLNPGKLTGFVDAFSKSTFGDNIGVDQLFTLGQSMQGIAAGRVTFITVPTVGEANSRGNEDLRAEDNNALFDAIRQGTPLPGETPAKDDASQQGKAKSSPLKQEQPGAVDPKTVKLQVLNGGNEQGGIAADTADSLAEFGFQIVRVDSSPEKVDKTVIRYSKSRAAQAQLVAAAVPGATLQEDPSMSGAIVLIVGPEYDGKVVSPTGGGPVPELPDGLSTVNAGDVSCA